MAGMDAKPVPSMAPWPIRMRFVGQVHLAAQTEDQEASARMDRRAAPAGIDHFAANLPTMHAITVELLAGLGAGS